MIHVIDTRSVGLSSVSIKGDFRGFFGYVGINQRKVRRAMYLRISECIECKDLAVEDKVRIAEQSYEKIIQGLDKDDRHEIEKPT